MAVSRETFFGGAIEYALAVSDKILDRNYRVHVVTPDATGRSLKCPDPTNMRAGVWFWVVNEGTDAVTVKDHNGTSIGSLNGGLSAEIRLGVDADQVTKKWYPGLAGTHAVGTYVAGAQLKYEVRIASDTINVNIRDEVIAQGWNGNDVIEIDVFVESGVSIGSSAVATPAMRTGTPFPAGTVIDIVNDGNIDGASGKGGDGYNTVGSVSAESGEAGGNAFTADVAVRAFDNLNGKIRGGAGGGGGSGGNTSGGTANGGGGGGGQGRGGGRGGGPYVTGNNGYVAAGFGNPSGPGSGGTGANITSPPNPVGTTGGDGGVWGGAGQDGVNGDPINIPISDKGSGGAGGSATEGESLITFTNEGTIIGARNG